MKKTLWLILCLVLAGCASNHSFVLLEKTAVDQKTGLVWSKSANPAGQQLEWRGDDNVYAFIQKLNKENFAGYADWRVPTREEMSELISYAKSLGYDSGKYETWPFKKLGQLGFSDVRDYGYWTSTRESKESIYVADLATGEVQPKPDTKPFYLWPVRGGRGR